jgi:hypothetical protein
MLAASGVRTVNATPLFTTPGVEVMVGRAPLNRYAGE